MNDIWDLFLSTPGKKHKKREGTDEIRMTKY